MCANTNVSDVEFIRGLSKDMIYKYVSDKLIYDTSFVKDISIVVSSLEYVDSEEFLKVSFMIENSTRVFFTNLSYKELREHIDFQINNKVSIRVCDIRPTYFLGKWVAFRQEGMEEILHGKVYDVDEKKKLFFVKNKKGRKRCFAYHDFVGFTSRPTNVRRKPKITMLNGEVLECYK